MAAGLANLDLITEAGFYERLTATTSRLAEGIAAAAKDAGVPMATVAVGGMFGLFFTEAERVENFEQAAACDLDAFKGFFHGMLDAGVYLAPSAFEAGFVSSAHGDQEIEDTLAAARKVLSAA
jgi:glutamate-1-semialdehyde 2,1-aminomutase